MNAATAACSDSCPTAGELAAGGSAERAGAVLDTEDVVTMLDTNGVLIKETKPLELSTVITEETN